MLFLISFFLPFFVLILGGKITKQTNKQKTTQNRTEAPAQLSGALQVSLCIKFGPSVLHFECIDQQYFPQVTLLLCHEAACQSKCFMSVFPSQLDSGARVMESIFHQTGSSFSFLSAAQPRAAKVDQASLVR